MVGYGQLASLLLGSLARVPETGGPAAGKTLGQYRCSDTALHRWWNTALGIVSRMDAPQRLAFWAKSQRGRFVSTLSALRGLATDVELQAFHLVDADMQLISADATASPTNLGATEGWYKQAEWRRGSIADEEDGSLRVAALVEYYAHDRQDFAAGHAAGSISLTFTKAALAATQRSALAVGHSRETWNALLPHTKAQKVLDYLAGCAWPAELHHWREGSVQLVADMHDLFLYSESGGVGLPAQRELLNTPARMRMAIMHFPLAWGVVEGSEDAAAMRASLRRLVEASATPPPEFVTLAGVHAVESMLGKSRVHCTGAEWAAKPVGDRMAEGVRLVGQRRGVELASAGGGLAPLALHAPDTKSGSVAGYDKLRLLDLKGESEYVTTKRQLLAAHAASQTDRAILIGLRGASANTGAATASGGGSARLAPLKVFHDLLLGNKDAYLVDKDLEACVPELRRGMASFWGRRVAKVLGVELTEDAPLEALAEAMATPAKWEAAPPDFYALALVPVRVAAGEQESGVYRSHNHSVGAPPYENIAVVNSLQALVVSLLETVGVLNVEVPDVAAAGVDLSSPADLFNLAVDLYNTVGSLSTTAAKMGKLITDGIKEFGARRGEVLASHDPKRRLNPRLLEFNAGFMSSFTRSRKAQARGKATVSELRQAGYQLTPLQDDETRRRLSFAPPDTRTKAPVDDVKAGGGGLKSGKKRPLDGAEELADEPPTVARLIKGGDILHVSGGLRGPNGCCYMLAGPEGLAAALAASDALRDICPAWFTAFRAGVPPDDLDAACGQKSHKAGGAHHPKPDDELKFASRHIKLSNYRVKADGSKFEPRTNQKSEVAEGKGKGKGGKGKGAGGGGSKGARTLAAASTLAKLASGQPLTTGPPPASGRAVATMLLAAAASSHLSRRGASVGWPSPAAGPPPLLAGGRAG